MDLKNIPAGKDIPNDFNVVIEISANALPVKYEVDKDSGALFVDRFLATPMHYPCNYGFVPNTLCDDGDPTDVLVLTPFPIQAGSVIRCRAIGVLEMEDEAGLDNKVLALPIEKLCPDYADIQDIDQLPKTHTDRIGHFFEHYKDLEEGKWVKVKSWHNAEAARQEIQAGVDAFKG